MTYLLDTNIISEIMRKAPAPEVFEWVAQLEELVLSVISLDELVYGLRRKSLLTKEAWLRQVLADRGRIIELSERAAHWAGEQRALAELKGKQVTQADSFIAATDHEHGLVLATRNTRDFEDFGIALFNPFR